jgi:hypothetical protein
MSWLLDIGANGILGRVIELAGYRRISSDLTKDRHSTWFKFGGEAESTRCPDNEKGNHLLTLDRPTGSTRGQKSGSVVPAIRRAKRIMILNEARSGFKFSSVGKGTSI